MSVGSYNTQLYVISMPTEPLNTAVLPASQMGTIVKFITYSTRKIMKRTGKTSTDHCKGVPK